MVKKRKGKRKSKYSLREKYVKKKYSDNFISDLSTLDKTDSLSIIKKERKEEII